MARPSQFVKPILLYALPLLGLALALVTVELIVPRRQAAIDEALALIKAAKPTFGAGVMAAFYHVGIAATLASAVCAISLWWCFKWIYAQGFRELTPGERPFFGGGLIFAIAAPILFLACHRPFECKRFAIDDCVTTELFKDTIQRAHPTSFAFAWDADVLAWLVFTTYLVSTLTVAVAVGTAPLSGRDRASGQSASLTIQQRTSVLNSVLLLTTAVLLCALLAAKLRFDVGLATLALPPTKEPAANLPFAAYQTVASAIMAYWATVLSLCLALIYLPGACLLASDSGKASTFVLGQIFAPTEENFMRLLKLAAILSPPVINKLVDVISTSPKGV